MPQSPHSAAPQPLAADSRPVVFFVATFAALCGMALGVAATWFGPVTMRDQVIDELGEKYIAAAAKCEGPSP